MVKWAGVLTAVVVIVADVVANLMVTMLTRDAVPTVINSFAIGVAAVATIVAFVAHLYGRIDAKLDLVIELLVGRFDEVESRIGDRNSGFVEGYLLSHSPDATVVPLSSRASSRRGNGTGEA
jgi:hypothetical protein